MAQIAQAFNAFSDKLSVVMVQLRDASASVKTQRMRLRQVIRIFPGVPSRRHQAFAKPPAPWKRSRPPLRSQTSRQQKRMNRLARPLPPHPAAATSSLRPSAPCSPSNWLPRKSAISPASLTASPSRPIFWRLTPRWKRHVPGSKAVGSRSLRGST